MNAAMIFDIVLLVVLISTAMHCAGKGFLAGIVHFIGNLLSFGCCMDTVRADISCGVRKLL